MQLTSGDRMWTFKRPELWLFPAARWTPLWRDVLLGKSPLPGMKAISTAVSWLDTQRDKYKDMSMYTPHTVFNVTPEIHRLPWNF